MTMPTGQRLPQELYDCIIDELRDQPNSLKTCSLVSKSWAAQSQKHIFSTVKFSNDRDIGGWRNAFPDPASSLAHHARKLIINSPKELPEDLFPSFCNVTHLFLEVYRDRASPISLTGLHGFTPFLKSLETRFSYLHPIDILNLADSFPLLDNLSIIAGPSITPDTKATPPKPLKFSGSLHLSLHRKTMDAMVNHLLSLPGGIHFRELSWSRGHDSSSAMALISACASTLKSLRLYTWGTHLDLLL